MSTIAILVHGYNVTNPENTVGKFRPYFESIGCMVETFTYGYVPWTWQVKKRNPAIAKRLSERIEYWDRRGYKVLIVNHSNGATLTYLAQQYIINRQYGNHRMAKIWRVLSIHPALTETLHPCINAEKVAVVYNHGDKAVRAGKWLSSIVKFFTPKKYQARPWGEMGRDGYQGTAENVVNYDTGDSNLFNPTAHGHSDEFSKEKAPYFLYLFTNIIMGNTVFAEKEMKL